MFHVVSFFLLVYAAAALLRAVCVQFFITLCLELVLLIQPAQFLYKCVYWCNNSTHEPRKTCAVLCYYGFVFSCHWSVASVALRIVGHTSQKSVLRLTCYVYSKSFPGVLNIMVVWVLENKLLVQRCDAQYSHQIAPSLCQSGLTVQQWQHNVGICPSITGTVYQIFEHVLLFFWSLNRLRLLFLRCC